MNSSSSPSSSASDTESDHEGGVRMSEKLRKLFGGKESLQAFLNVGKAREILLWKDKKGALLSMAAGTIIWGLMEGAEYHFVTLVCHLLIFLMFFIFVSSKLTLITKSSPLRLNLMFSEDTFLSAASAVRLEINRWLARLYDISSGKDFKQFITMLGSLWLLSVIGGACSFLTLCYIVFALAHTVPVVCERYGEAINREAYKASIEMKKHFRKFDQKVLSKIPRGPVKTKSRKRK